MQDRLLQPVTLQRGLLVSATVLVPLFGVFYRISAPHEFDPYSWRFAYAALSFGFLVGSYRWRWLEDRLHGAILLLAVLLDVAIVGLGAVNGFSGDRALGVVVTISCLVICFRNGWETVACGLFTAALLAGAYAVSPETSEVSQPILQGGVLAVTVMVGVLNETRHRLQLQLERSRAELEVRVAERTEALAHSMALLEAEVEVRRQAEEDATAANRAKSVFLANMSHELRTPLNAILGYTEMLVEEMQDRQLAELLPDLGRVRRAAAHLLAMIGEILDLTAIESGKVQFRAHRVPIRTVLDDVVLAVRPMVETGRNRVAQDCDEGVAARADPERVRQILLNLVSNAAKYTEDGTISVRAWTEADRVRIVVEDTGIGIPAEAVPRLFEAFTQVDSSSTRRFEGTGLGLAVSRRLARALGGDVSVDSALGVGTTITVDLPRWQEGISG